MPIDGCNLARYRVSTQFTGSFHLWEKFACIVPEWQTPFIRRRTHRNLKSSLWMARPSLIAVPTKASGLAVTGDARVELEIRQIHFAFALRTTVAFSVGFALVIGVLRIVKGWPIHDFIIVGYVIVILLTPLAPNHMAGVTYDSGGFTTSTITVPINAVLGVGLASNIKGQLERMVPCDDPSLGRITGNRRPTGW